MEVLPFSPSPALAQVVRVFEVVRAGEAETHTLLPEPGLVLAFRFGGSAVMTDRRGARPLADEVVTGVRLETRSMRTAAGGAAVIAKLHVGAAPALFREGAHRLFGLTRALRGLRGFEDVALRGALAALATDAARVGHVDALLTARLRPDVAPDPIVAAALAAIAADPAGVRVAALSDDLDLAQDSLEKRFRRAVGATPKQLATLLRLRAALRGYAPGASLTELALAAGYYDQSHFIRNVRAATGDAPRRFLGRDDVC
ncbi:MAG: AraC family transcriptional regulator [Deltaproteobacteria bacterium]|nr:AraC family transcriptional regulator [Deltaproteobacteria bacterium]